MLGNEEFSPTLYANRSRRASRDGHRIPAEMQSFCVLARCACRTARLRASGAPRPRPNPAHQFVPRIAGPVGEVHSEDRKVSPWTHGPLRAEPPVQHGAA